MATIAERAPDCRTVTADHLSLRIGTVLHHPLDRPHPAHPLASFFLCVPIRFPNRPTGFPQIMKLAELMRDVGKDVGDRLP